MFIKDWKKEVFTIPNLLSMFRLILIPVYIVIYLNASELWEYVLAAMILSVSCLTDMIDGKIARHCNMISTVGIILDPIADKATQFALMLCLAIRHPILWFLLALFVIKELFQGIVGLIHLRQGKMLPGALLAGKVCTAVLFLSLILLVLFPDMPAQYVNLLAAIDLVVMLVSLVNYVLAYFGRNIKVQDMKGT